MNQNLFTVTFKKEITTYVSLLNFRRFSLKKKWWNMTWVERRLKKNKANAKEERENKTEKKLSSSVTDWEKHERLATPPWQF